MNTTAQAADTTHGGRSTPVRSLAPPHPRVSIKRWSARRIILLATAWVATSAAAAMFVDAIRAGLW